MMVSFQQGLPGRHIRSAGLMSLSAGKAHPGAADVILAQTDF
jgi:hypothetical protein